MMLCYLENIGRIFLFYFWGIVVVDDRILVIDFQKKSVIFVKMVGWGYIFQKYQGIEMFFFRELNGLVFNLCDWYVIVIDFCFNCFYVVFLFGRFFGMVDIELDNEELCKVDIFIFYDFVLLLVIVFFNGNVVIYRVLDRQYVKFVSFCFF